MATLKVTFTDDILNLVSRISFEQFPPMNSWEGSKNLTWGIDINNLYGGSFVFEDIAYILGLYDKRIEGTECDALGPRFPEEIEERMWSAHSYVLEHLQDIEEIIHQFCYRGGISAGTYKCKSNERIWEREE